MKTNKFRPLVVLVMVVALTVTVFAAQPLAQEGVEGEGLPPVVLAVGTQDPAGSDASCRYRLDGHKFLDVDGDGEWDAGEPGLAGWEIRLDNGKVTHTDEEGYYAFEGLKEGTYVVSEVCPAGWVQTAPGFAGQGACGSETHTAELCGDKREVNGLDFGNGEPGLSLIKTCPADVFLGDEVGYEVTVANTGNVALVGVRVEDAGIGLDETVDLAVGQSETFVGVQDTSGMRIVASMVRGPNVMFLPLMMPTVNGGGSGGGAPTRVLTDGELSNTATATAAYGGVALTATESCVTKVHALEVRKDIEPMTRRLYHWTIEKVVDDAGPHLVYVGDFIDAVYTVTVDLDDPPYSQDGWAVAGRITVTNPAPMDAELAAVSDVLSGGIEAEVDCPALTVPAGGTLQCSYGPAELPNGGMRSNTATAVLTNNDGGTTGFVGTVMVDFSGAAMEEQDTEVEVTDSLEGYLGTVRYDEVPVTFNYTRRIAAPEQTGDLIMLDNEVTLVTNNTGITGTSQAIVSVFVPRRISIGYEDLPKDRPNDWDYNDLVVNVNPVLEVSADHDLLAIEFEVEPMPGAGPTGGLTKFVHTFNLRPFPDAFSCDGTYTMERTRGGVTTVTSGVYRRGDNFVAIPFTKDLPDVVRMRIDFDVPAGVGCPFDLEIGDMLNQYHGEWLFFDPWIQPWDTGEQIHLLRTPASEYRILVVPVGWQWPMPDGNSIWNYYPKVSPPNPAAPQQGPIFVPLWWEE